MKLTNNSSDEKAVDYTKLVTESGLFDSIWYKENYGHLLSDDVSPIVHYLHYGFHENCDPSPLFSSQKYLDNNLDAKELGINPLLHYVLYGIKEGRSIYPSPVGKSNEEIVIYSIPSNRQREEIEFIENSKEFQKHWYRRQYLSNDFPLEHAVKHFVLFGAQSGLNPTPFFDTKYYLLSNSDIAEANIDPYCHYLRFGKREGRSSKPINNIQQIDKLGLVKDYSMSPSVEATVSVIVESQLFDLIWFNDSYDFSFESQEIAVLYYLLFGLIDGLDPSPTFSTAFYQKEHDDVRALNMNPLFHFAKYGQGEARATKYSELGLENSASRVLDSYALSEQEKSDIEVIQNSKWFNLYWYLETYSHWGLNSRNALKHYYLFGVKEGLDPCPTFSTSHYVQEHSDVTNSGIHPLVHFVKYGRREKRRYVPSKFVKLSIIGKPSIGNGSSSVVDFSEIKLQIDDVEQNINNVSPDNSESAGQIFEKLLFTKNYMLSDLKIAGELTEPLNESLKIFSHLSGNSQVNLNPYNKEISSLKDVYFASDYTLRLNIDHLTRPNLSDVYAIQARGSEGVSIQHLSSNCSSIKLFDVNLVDRFNPLFIVYVNNQTILDFDLFAFPSLIRGGVNFAELAVNLDKSYLQKLRLMGSSYLDSYLESRDAEKVKRIIVSNLNTSGAELMFDESYSDWMERYFGVEISFTETDEYPVLPDEPITIGALIALENSEEVDYSSKLKMRDYNFVERVFQPELSRTIETFTQICKLPAISISLDTPIDNDLPRQIFPVIDDIEKSVVPIANTSMLIWVSSEELSDIFWETCLAGLDAKSCQIIIVLDMDSKRIVLPEAACNLDRLSIIQRKSTDSFSSIFHRCVSACDYDDVIFINSRVIAADLRALKVLSQITSDSASLTVPREVSLKQSGKSFSALQLPNCYDLALRSGVTNLKYSVTTSFDKPVTSHSAVVPNVFAAHRSLLIKVLKEQDIEHVDGHKFFLNLSSVLSRINVPILRANSVAVTVVGDDEREAEFVLDDPISYTIAELETTTPKEG